MPITRGRLFTSRVTIHNSQELDYARSPLKPSLAAVGH